MLLISEVLPLRHLLFQELKVCSTYLFCLVRAQVLETRCVTFLSKEFLEIRCLELLAVVDLAYEVPLLQ